MTSYKCTYIQYHANWTKFFFTALDGVDCVSISVVRRIDENASKKYKQGEIYAFQL